jgi:hypothetical protein
MILRQPRSRPRYHRAGPRSQLVDGALAPSIFKFTRAACAVHVTACAFGNSSGQAQLKLKSQLGSLPGSTNRLGPCHSLSIAVSSFSFTCVALGCADKILCVRGKNHTRRGILSSRRVSCADDSETRTHPPTGCGTTFELHWKAVELTCSRRLAGGRQILFQNS